jgi:signal transduction histidine kinase
VLVVWVAAVLASLLVVAVFRLRRVGRAADEHRTRAGLLADALTEAEARRARDQLDQLVRPKVASELLTNLARRNQSLLNRQLAKIEQLEALEPDTETLAQLFTLDHLATRMRRNAESLLVLSGEELPHRWGASVALSEVARGAIAEIEDYTRVDVSVEEDLVVAGRAVGNLTHLLAELLDNATTFSPPSTRVVLGGARTPDGSYLLTITDDGIGMSGAELGAANRTLAAPLQTDLSLSGVLGLHVVARLATRFGIRVWLTARPCGGLVAGVTVPPELLCTPSRQALGVAGQPVTTR